MDATKLPKMQSKEVPTDGRPINLPGIYRHKDTKQPFITSSDFDAGVAQADFLMHPLWKDAWVREGDVPSHEELLKMRKAQEIKDATEEALEAGKEAEEMKTAKKKAIEEAKASEEANLDQETK